MTNEQFESMVRKLEPEAAQNPPAYRSKVLWLGILGYGYVLFLLLGTLALIGVLIALMVFVRRGGGVAIKFVIVLGLFALAVLRALWVSFPKPEGIVLTPTDAPELWATVNGLREKLAAPAFHQILLSSEFNASVVQRPRLGIFGWSENYLTVGLPLMHTLTKAQFDSVIAHEMGHLRGGHGKFGGWVYRVNATWAQLLDRLEDGGGANALVSGFFKWYAPQFAAYSFPLRRQDEYEADRAASESAGRDATVGALSLLPVWDNYLGKSYWKPFYKQVHEQETAPSSPYSGLLAHPLAPALSDDRADAERALNDALREETTFADSHPALPDRIKSLGGESVLPASAPAPGETALAAYLPRAETFARRLDAEFVENIAPVWAHKYAEAQEERKTLDALTARVVAGETLPPVDAWEHASLTQDYRSDEEAMPLFQTLADRADVRPVKEGLLTAGALLQIGQHMMERRDPAAVGYIESAMDVNSNVRGSALSLLYGYHRMMGDNDAARNVYVEALRHSDRKNAAAEERVEMVGGNVRYEPHGLSGEQLAPIVAAISAVPRLGDAYLVRKQVTHDADKPVLIFAFSLKDEWRSLRAEADWQELHDGMSEALSATLPTLFETLPFGSEWNNITITNDSAGTMRGLVKVPGAKIVAAKR
ncbi:MAG: M48 family metallopeptidase [Armatimonadetes bacterium]|nr:M48 family metallopeptidase [Armatimonadota bacterium]